ncbi:carbohydrate diacid transcriptional activator CdaR [Mycolicibacterium chubuense]|uniref:Carbohydrate diacid transcriptional activator CdaR n=1 Tax=Mycolicibacterium chubuense TaxID=1800 RepID=A0A0J6ZB09_MYCCU|nr:carbohydrate diacid transcriptional activator CdaR [Mycolicibacterium chubuense]SPY46376.1 purine catabolism PurC domain-containing protein [Mycolicibacterium chubuense]
MDLSGKTINSYTSRVVYDVRAVAEYLGGDLAVGSIDAAAPVESVIVLDDLVVPSSPGHATLTVGPSSRWIEAVAHGRQPLAGCVAVIADGSVDGATRDALTDRVTAVHVPGQLSEVVYPRLTALIAGDQAAEDRRVTTGIKVLTQVARRGGVVAVVAELAHRIDGWAVLLDARGEVITTAGAGGLHVRDAVAAALGRRVRIRHPGLQIHPVGQGEDVSAHLVIGARGSTSRSRDLASQVAALLDLVLHTADHPTTERLGREVMMSTLLRGGPDARNLLRRWGVHEPSLTAFAVASRSRAIDAERLAIRWLDELGAVHVLSAEKGRVVGFIGDERADELAVLVEGLATEAGMPLRLGLGSPAKVERLANSAAEARQALEIAVVDSRPVVWYRSLTTVSNVLDQLDESATARIAAVLDPLRDDAGRHGPLTRTLEVYLSEHGAWGATAARLQIHRQTLAARIRRAEALTGLSMSSPDDRAAAWLAIRALKSPGSVPRD